jgi:hypothetical protein
MKERNLWSDILSHIFMLGMTVVYMVVAPCSLFWAILVPLHLAWIMYDNFFANPVTLATVPMLALKFIPGNPIPLF